MLLRLQPSVIRPMAKAFILAVAFISATSMGAKAADAKVAEHQRPLDLADVLNMRELNGDPAFHPFEDLVALTVSRRSDAPQKKSTSHFLDNVDERGVPYSRDAAKILITDLHSGLLRQIGHETARSWSPVWSPDGSTLAYLSDADGVTTLYAWNRKTEQATRLALPAVPMGSSRRLLPTWLSDSRHIIVAVRSASLPVEKGAIPDDSLYADGRKIFTSTGSVGVDGSAEGWRVLSRADLIVVSLEGQPTRHLVKGLNILGFWVSPDNQRIVIEETLGPAPASQRLRSSLAFLDLRSGILRRLSLELPGGFAAMNGAWLADSECFVHLNVGAVLKTCLAGEALDSETINTTASVESLIEVDSLHDSNLIGLARNDRGHSQLISIDRRHGTVSELASSERYVFLDIVTRRGGEESKRATPRLVLARDMSTQEAIVLRIAGTNTLDEIFRDKVAFSSTRATLTHDDQGFFAFLEGPDAPPDVWRLDASGAHQQNLSVLNESLNGVLFAEPIWLRASPDARNHLGGVLLVPKQWHSGVRCPLIVRPYGNQKASRLLYRFGVNGAGVENLQLLASRGYAVLVPTLPVRPGAPLESIRERIEELVDAAVVQGIADPDRLGVFGHSFGGYAAIGLAAGSSPVFRSTVVTGAVGLNLFSYYGFMDERSTSYFVGWTEEGQSNVGANPWSDASRLLANSPLFQVDRIHGPVLIMVGEADTPRVPQSNELYVALRRLEREAEYRIYQREPHSPGWWASKNAEDYLNRVLSWFDSTLGVADGDTSSAVQRSAHLCH